MPFWQISGKQNCIFIINHVLKSWAWGIVPDAWDQCHKSTCRHESESNIGKHSTAPAAVITVLTQTNRKCRLSEQQCCIWSVWFILISLYIRLDTKCCWQYHFHGKLAINPYKDKSRNQILPDILLHSAQYFMKNYMYLHKLCTSFCSFLTAGRLLL